MPTSDWYRASADAATVPADVAERALEWLLELQEQHGAPQCLAALEHWRAEHPDHERAWQRIESVQARLLQLSTPGTAGIARATLATPASRPRRRAVKALAVLVCTGGLAWNLRERSAMRQWAADYRTDVGERRSVVLSDGTQMMLNTASAVDIRFDAAERRVRLLAGEILITTAKDARPFLVESAHGTVQALGTRYSVRQQDGKTDVCVFEGAVRIRPRDSAGQAVVLQSGHCASYTAQAVDAPTPAQTAGIAWAEGFIVARGMRVDAFIAELSRYSRTALSCDPALAGLRVSGSFPLDDVGKVLDAVSGTLDLRTETVTRFWGQREIRLVPAPGARPG
ncbi:FecR domain-containing protein [Cupriavidus sp. NPDC089707]|uniref:FecR domain-containing protein n=1 Tax=Cupriavidus sp. NPDC089707 TaxID=3363963 RepID=UPI00381B36DA